MKDKKGCELESSRGHSVIPRKWSHRRMVRFYMSVLLIKLWEISKLVKYIGCAWIYPEESLLH